MLEAPGGAAAPGQNGAPHNVAIMGQMPPVPLANEDNDDEDDDPGHFEDDTAVPMDSHDSPISEEKEAVDDEVETSKDAADHGPKPEVEAEKKEEEEEMEELIWSTIQ